MSFNQRNKELNYSKYELNNEKYEAYYGLPEDIDFCAKCVISNQRPNSAVETKHTINTKKDTIKFNEGICDACLVTESKSQINWNERKKELEDLCDKFRSTDGSYDCLVPGSGGKDSFYQAHMLKYEFGMNPLTITWAPHLYTKWGWKNHQSWINAGFDNQLVTPNGRVHRLLTRLAVEKLFHPFQPFMIGQKVLAPKIAAQQNIKLIFYGENEAEYGNPIQDTTSSIRDFKYFTSDNDSKIYIGGTSLMELKDDYNVDKNELIPYMPINPQICKDKQIEVHYLGYYLKWHPQAAYYYAVEHGGFEASPERTLGTYSKYNSIDDKIDDFHYYTTYIKFGIGRATYDASQEIRSKDIDRDEGISLVRKYDGEYPERFEKEIFEYLSINQKELPQAYSQFEQPIMDKDYFNHLCDYFRSPHLWNKQGSNWRLRKTIFE